MEATDIRKAGLSRRGKIRDSSERQVMDYTLACPAQLLLPQETGVCMVWSSE